MLKSHQVTLPLGPLDLGLKVEVWVVMIVLEEVKLRRREPIMAGDSGEKEITGVKRKIGAVPHGNVHHTCWRRTRRYFFLCRV